MSFFLNDEPRVAELSRNTLGTIFQPQDNELKVMGNGPHLHQVDSRIGFKPLARLPSEVGINLVYATSPLDSERQPLYAEYKAVATHELATISRSRGCYRIQGRSLFVISAALARLRP